MYFKSHSHFKLFWLIVDQFLFLIQLLALSKLGYIIESFKYNVNKTQLWETPAPVSQVVLSLAWSQSEECKECLRASPFLSLSLAWLGDKWMFWYFDLLTGDRGQMLVVVCSCSWELPRSLSNTALLRLTTVQPLTFFYHLSGWYQHCHLTTALLPPQDMINWHSKLAISKPINNSPNHLPTIRISCCAGTEIMTDGICRGNSIVGWIIYFDSEEKRLTVNQKQYLRLSGVSRRCNYYHFSGWPFWSSLIILTLARRRVRHEGQVLLRLHRQFPPDRPERWTRLCVETQDD